MNDFAPRLLGELPGDVCWSPYSVESALRIVLRLAEGSTRARLLELLGSEELPGSHPPGFAVSDSLWARDFLNLPAPVRLFDDPAAALKLINAEVAEATRGLIPELLKSLAPSTTAVVVNALYLKAQWWGQFWLVGDEPFHSPSGDRLVPMMQRQSSFPYARLHGWEVVKIPAHDDVEAVVLLPSDGMDLDSRALSELLDAHAHTEVLLTMPTLKLSYGDDLRPALERLGLAAVFAQGGMPHPDMVIDQVIHQAVLRVDEHGIEGTAATAIMAVGSPVPVPVEPVEVTVDRPFLFLVRHSVTGAIYFLARVENL
ncbi:serpin family protein [Lentzea tibetensis]|uniref:Serpin family protein n=1 Tax=Lentzea tibetensis TaxID=2591470 RepID=A0A563EH03_9PSEU|nr:serpin family protein [Lentzea tibetensis]TWP45800.1 serpin family protein [Lentzea tibetensis]